MNAQQRRKLRRSVLTDANAVVTAGRIGGPALFFTLMRRAMHDKSGAWCRVFRDEVADKLNDDELRPFVRQLGEYMEPDGTGAVILWVVRQTVRYGLLPP